MKNKQSIQIIHKLAKQNDPVNYKSAARKLRKEYSKLSPRGKFNFKQNAKELLG